MITAQHRSKVTLAPFQAWLRGEGTAPSTIRVYVSQLRGVFPTSQEGGRLLADPDQLQQAISQQDELLTSAGRRVFRAAVRAFVRFLNTHGHSLALPEFHDHRREREHPIVPALEMIVHDGSLPLKRIPFIRWGNVKAGERGRVRVFDQEWNRMYEVPFDALRQINVWANGAGEARLTHDHPLIPREPLSRSPMPAGMLKRLAYRL